MALLCDLLESVGGQKNTQQRCFDAAWSANKSFAAFALLQSRVFDGAILESETLAELPGERLLQHILIRAPEGVRGVLPTKLVHNIGHES